MKTKPKKENAQPMNESTIKPFPEPDQKGAPFLNPIGANQGPEDVAPGNWTLYCFPSAATAVYNEYKAAAERQGYTENLQLDSGTANGSYPQFGPGAHGVDIFLITGTVTDSKGNNAIISDVIGERLSGNVFPFSPGKTAYGDKNYKVVEGDAVRVPGILQLIGQSSGVALVPGEPTAGGFGRGIWIPVPVE